MLGYPGRMTGMHLRRGYTGDAGRDHRQLPPPHRRRGASIRYTTIGWHRNREPVYLQVHETSVIYRGRPAVVGVGVNITEQRRQQNALQESASSCASWRPTSTPPGRAARRIAHRTARRARRHAHLDQARHPAHQPAQRRRGDRAIVGDLLQLTQDSIDTVRTLSEDLRPGGLDHLGLRSALEAELQRFSARTEIACELVAEVSRPSSRRRAPPVYRICRRR